MNEHHSKTPSESAPVPTPAATTTLKNLTTEKLISFAVGTQKKSRFQKAREEQEAKKKLDEEEAAKVYQSFVQSFQEDDDEEGEDRHRGGKRFVRGGRMNHGSSEEKHGNSGEIYRLSSKDRPQAVTKTSEIDKLMEETRVSLLISVLILTVNLLLIFRPSRLLRINRKNRNVKWILYLKN